MPVLELTDDKVLALVQNLPEALRQRVLKQVAGKNPAVKPRFGSAKKDIISIAPDFDAPLEDFNEYME